MPDSDPLRIVVLGDSVAWGQGLLAEHKYTSLVAGILGQPPDQVEMKAHSGAIIGANYSGSQAPSDPEVPADAPTILAQVGQVSLPATVDVVLLNGGINDVNIRRILDPFTRTPDLHRYTVDACYRDMKILLAVAATAFAKPTCRFVVTGYYPILSPESDVENVEAAGPLDHLLSLYGLGFPLYLDRTLIINHVVGLAMQFWHDSDAALQRAVNESRGELNLGDRLQFVPSSFAEPNALFTDDAWLFGFDADFAAEDEVIPGREAACTVRYPGPVDFVSREVCFRASVGHPNPTGAAALAAAIGAALG